VVKCFWPGRRLDFAGIRLRRPWAKTGAGFFGSLACLLSTGDELVEIGASPEAGRFGNSNSYSLAAQISRLRRTGPSGGCPDDRVVWSSDEEGLQCDLLLLTGRRLYGKYDWWSRC